MKISLGFLGSLRGIDTQRCCKVPFILESNKRCLLLLEHLLSIVKIDGVAGDVVGIDSGERWRISFERLAQFDKYLGNCYMIQYKCTVRNLFPSSFLKVMSLRRSGTRDEDNPASAHIPESCSRW